MGAHPTDWSILRKQLEGEVAQLQTGLAWRQNILKAMSIPKPKARLKARHEVPKARRKPPSKAFLAAARRNIKKANAVRMRIAAAKRRSAKR